MRINEMSADKAFETMAKLVPYIYNISDDETIKKAKSERNERTDDPEEAKKAGERFLWSVIPAVLARHKEDVFGIVSVMEGCSIEDVQKMTYAELMECINGAGIFDVLSFFKFAVRMSVAI